jgi:hypothetical protein
MRVVGRAGSETLGNYYYQEFTKIAESNEDYKGQWNIPAAILGGFWTLYAKLWVPSAIVWVLAGISVFVPFLIILPAIYCYYLLGSRGTYLRYRNMVYGENRAW